jgi:hypothetical protein
VDDSIERRGDLLADRAVGRLCPAISTRFSSRCSASRGPFEWIVVHRAVVARVHGLEHVQHLVAADLADDDAVGTHTQGVAHQVALRDLPLPSMLGGRVSSRTTCGCWSMELGRVLDRDDALLVRNVAREDVEQRRLAGAGAAGDQQLSRARTRR